MYNFFRINTQSIYFQEALQIYRDSFPVAEQHLHENLIRRLENPKSYLFTALHEKEVVFMAVLWEMQGTEFIFLDYLAVKEAFRANKMGAYFLDFLKEKFIKNSKKILLEIEKPENPPTENLLWKRWYFYRKHGAKALQNVQSVVPPLQTPDFTPVCLLFLGENEDVISGEKVRLLIIQLFQEIYNRPEQDFFTQKVLASVGKTVRLSGQDLFYVNLDKPTNTF